MGDYRKLNVYLEARALSRDIFFRATRPLPLCLRWRLGGQLDKAADSIGSNLAEGHGRKNPEHGNAELVRYGFLAHGSACEVEHWLCGLRDRELIVDVVYTDLNERVGRIRGQLLSLINFWRREDRGRKAR